jgi:integrase
MARTIKDSQLGNRTARQALKIRGKPHYRSVESGLHVGYRRLRGKSGTWVARHYIGDQHYIVEAIGTADDLSDADGLTVLSFDQAVAKARKLHTERAREEAGIAGPYTVAQAMATYVRHLELRGKRFENVERAFGKYIAKQLGKVEVAKLTSERLQNWLADVAAMPARGRASDARARKVSANRTLTTLKAALQLAFRQGKVTSDSAWRQVEKFKGVDRKRERFLSIAEAQRLINAADGNFRPMIAAALATGCRYGELCALEVRDYHPDSGTLSIRTSKSGKPRKVYLNGEGQELFQDLAAGRRPHDPLIPKSTGEAFSTSQQIRRMRDLCERANIEPISFHQLRHTYASHLATAGTPLMIIAESLGHTTTAMTQRYSHLAPSHVAETIRANAPTFGLEKSNVRSIR